MKIHEIILLPGSRKSKLSCVVRAVDELRLPVGRGRGGGTTPGLSLPASGPSDAIIVHVKGSYLLFFTVCRLVLNMALYQSYIPLRGTFLNTEL